MSAGIIASNELSVSSDIVGHLHVSYQLSHFVQPRFLKIPATSPTTMSSIWYIENVGRDLVLQFAGVSQVSPAFILRGRFPTLRPRHPPKSLGQSCYTRIPRAERTVGFTEYADSRVGLLGMILCPKFARVCGTDLLNSAKGN